MPRILHFWFKLVWLLSALAFGFFARDAHQSKSIKLPRYEFRIPANYQVQIGGVRFQEIINGIADTHDKSVAALESSIRSSATLSFRLNLMCCIAALVGLATQFGQYRHDETQKSKRQDGASDDDSRSPVSPPHLSESKTEHDHTTSA